MNVMQPIAACAREVGARPGDNSMPIHGRCRPIKTLAPATFDPRTAPCFCDAHARPVLFFGLGFFGRFAVDDVIAPEAP